MDVFGDHAYARTPSAIHVVDVRSAKVITEVARPPEVADVITGTS